MAGDFLTSAASILGGSEIGKTIGGLFGGGGGDSPRIAAAKNAELQRQFAQHSVRWRVEDANRAGVHPLFALGANVSSATPTAVGVDREPIGERLGRAGQDISRAINSTASSEQRAMSRLQVENQSLQNDLLRSQIARENSAQIGPGFPDAVPNRVIDGQGNADVIDTPLRRTSPVPGVPSKEVGSLPDFTLVNTSSGGLAPVPSADAKQRTEDSWADVIWSYRNLLLPNFMNVKNHNPLGSMKWDPLRQEYRYPPGSKVYQRGKLIERY